MSERIRKHEWSDLASAPSEAGVYAWYYSPEITNYDLEHTIATLKALSDQQTRQQEAESLVRKVLDERVFQYFREGPYEARIEGSLKPSFSGQLTHNFSPSASLVSRIAENPDRLRLLRDVLRISAPMFASPIYVGMSDNLRNRLAGHKALIERYRSPNMRRGRPGTADAGFAWQVAQRRIPPERLFVYTCVTESGSGIELDLENVLNRIFYPILGRN